MTADAMTEKELEAVLTKLSYPYKLAIYTDRADFVDTVTDFDKLLELRVFGNHGEFRAYRDVINIPFKTRLIEDDNLYDGCYDEVQYLDIDTAASDKNSRIKKTTGGGKFTLPVDAVDKELLRIRYYYQYDADGIARKVDWRIVGFEEKEEIDHG